MLSLSNTQLKRYLEYGYVVVESPIDPNKFELLIEEISKNIEEKSRELASRGNVAELYPDAPFSQRLALIYSSIVDREARNELWRVCQGKHHKTAGMFAIWTDPELLSVVEEILGPEILAHPQYNLRAKLPNQDETVVPWHQDLALLEREADDTFMVNFWIPLIDAPMETGAL